MSYLQEYSLWLKNVTPREQEELISLSEDEKRERFYRSLEFGTAGMRGILRTGSNGMNIYTVARATRGLAEYIIACGEQKHGAVISYDSRHMSREFADLAAGVLAARGITVRLFSMLHPVPALSFAVRHCEAFAGVMITASHNPKEYNGYKVYGSDGAQLSLEPAAHILQIIESLPYFPIEAITVKEGLSRGLITMLGDETDDAYISCLLPLFDLSVTRGSRLRAVYTPLHGAGYSLVTRMFREMGLNIDTVKAQTTYDGDFPTVKSPNPENAEALSMAVAQAAEEGASIALGTDPDCDRLGVAVKSGGEFINLTGNQAGCVMLYNLLEGMRAAGTLPKNGAVIKTIVTSEMARAIAADFGVELVEVLTGFKFIGEKIKEYEQTGEHTYLFGFEESYGYLMGTHARDKDGVVAAALMMYTACRLDAQGMTVPEGLNALYEKYGWYREKTLSFTFDGIEGAQKISALMSRLAGSPPSAFGAFSVVAYRDYNTSLRTKNGRVTEIDLPKSNVLYFELDGGWVAVRPSGTEPKIKLYLGVKGNSNADAEQLLSKLEAAVRAAVL